MPDNFDHSHTSLRYADIKGNVVSITEYAEYLDFSKRTLPIDLPPRGAGDQLLQNFYDGKEEIYSHKSE